jgi:peptidoglycan/xylan/chitin deacetylase (PgdA/CDA1 family)
MAPAAIRLSERAPSPPAALQPGEIVLMHAGCNPADHTTFDADALPRVITELRVRGSYIVILDALAR